MSINSLVKKDLDKLYDDYAYELASLIEMKFNLYVVPYLDKHNLHFRSGMGIWTCYEITKDGTHREYFLPKYLLDLLSIEVPGYNQDFGSLCPDYN